MKKVLLIGEPLIRISPLHHLELSDGVDAKCFFGGSEVNIACTLQGFGQEAKMFTALPQNSLGDRFSTFLSSHGIDTSSILRLGDRIGLYYLEEGFGCRTSKVYYDRKFSSFSSIDERYISIADVLDGVEWIHFSGITLAVAASASVWLKKILTVAKSLHIPISFDLNWRSSLIEIREAKTLFSEFASLADYCFGIEPLLQDPDDWTLFNREGASEEELEHRMSILKKKYSLKGIFHTIRQVDSNGTHTYQAYGLMETFYSSKALRTQVLQRVGSGDAFVAGALYQLLRGKGVKDVTDFALASGLYKCSLEGDFMVQPVHNIYSILGEAKDVIR